MLKTESLSAFYGKKQVLFDLSLEIERGKFTAIIGANGSGKSTLMSALTSQIAYSGRILLGGREINSIPRRERARTVSFLPQSLPITSFSVEETVAFGREPYTDLSGRLSEGDREAVEKSIDRCGISHLKCKKLTEISGGERQMAYLAMTLAQDADLLLLDEPTTYMDASRAKEFLQTLKSAQTEGKTVAAVMHDLTQAVRFADNIILIDAGKAVCSGSRGDCLNSGKIESVMKVEMHRLEDGTVVFI